VSAGAIAGIVVGAVAVLALVGWLTWWSLKPKDEWYAACTPSPAVLYSVTLSHAPRTPFRPTRPGPVFATAA